MKQKKTSMENILKREANIIEKDEEKLAKKKDKRRTRIYWI